MDPLLLLLPVLLLLATADAYPSACSTAACGNLTIAYPFWLNSSSTPASCGYPGLGLLCDANDTLLLAVQSHRYRVLGIDYATHTISLSVSDIDLTSCPFLHFNLTIPASSGLQLTLSDSNITFFYNCEKNTSRWNSAVELSGCTSVYNRSSYVMLDHTAAVSVTAVEEYGRGCEAVVVAPVLDARRMGAMADSPPAARYGDVLRGGFELRYTPNSEQCGECERSGGWCGYRHNQTRRGLGFTCFCDGGPVADRCSGTYVSHPPP